MDVFNLHQLLSYHYYLVSSLTLTLLLTHSYSLLLTLTHSLTYLVLVMAEECRNYQVDVSDELRDKFINQLTAASTEVFQFLEYLISIINATTNLADLTVMQDILRCLGASLTNSLTHLLTHWLTHSLSHAPTHSLTHLLTHSQVPGSFARMCHATWCTAARCISHC